MKIGDAKNIIAWREIWPTAKNLDLKHRTCIKNAKGNKHVGISVSTLTHSQCFTMDVHLASKDDFTFAQWSQNIFFVDSKFFHDFFFFINVKNRLLPFYQILPLHFSSMINNSKHQSYSLISTYETAPNLIQLTQNLTSDYTLI